MAKRFTEVTSQQAKKTLARRFIPLADTLRNMLTKFGLRTYRVAMVRTRWSGPRRGQGVPTVVSNDVILPTPKISSFDAIAQVAQAVGYDEVGSIELTQISGRFTEDQLRGYGPKGTDIPLNEEFFYEIEFFPNDGSPSQKRRFYPDAAPSYSPGALQWSLRLVKANEDRARNGDPR